MKKHMTMNPVVYFEMPDEDRKRIGSLLRLLA